MDYRFRFDVVPSNSRFLMDGLGMTLLISFLALVVSTVIGLLIVRQIGLTGVDRRDLYQYNTFSFLYH